MDRLTEKAIRLLRWAAKPAEFCRPVPRDAYPDDAHFQRRKDTLEAADLAVAMLEEHAALTRLAIALLGGVRRGDTAYPASADPLVQRAIKRAAK